jgi:hypothetical protein
MHSWMHRQFKAPYILAVFPELATLKGNLRIITSILVISCRPVNDEIATVTSIMLRQTIGAGLPRGGGILARPRFPARVLSQSQRKSNRTKSQPNFNGCKTTAFQNGSRPEQDNNGSGGGGGGGGDATSELNALLRLIVAYPATRGTIAEMEFRRGDYRACFSYASDSV